MQVPVCSESLINIARENGAQQAAVVLVAQIPFRREFRAACEQNTCGKFGRCWACPPDIGGIDELIEKARSYSHAPVFQTIGTLEDSFDIEGMEAAAIKHNAVIQLMAPKLAAVAQNTLKLGAGGCHVCARCAKAENEPCREPQKAVASLEAHGIAVSELAEICGMKYINGQNTVTFFGGFLF